MNFKIIFSLQTLCAVLLLCTFKLQAESFATETVLIIIDDSEPSEYGGQLTRGGQLNKYEGLGASGTDLLTALYEEECIVIVASSIAQYLMRYLQEVSYNPLDLEPAPKIKPQNWIKKKVSDYLYILIPKNYLNSRPNYGSAKGVSSKYTAEELAIGIMFASKKEISDKDFMSPWYHKKNTQYPEKVFTERVKDLQWDVLISWISNHFIQNLNTIFIPKNEYVNQTTAPAMAILLEGHGSKYTSLDDRIAMLTSWQKSEGYDVKSELTRLQNLKKNGQQSYAAGQIAGLNADDFARLVNFFQNNLMMRLLFISTCFGSTINLQTALKDIASETSKLQPSFPMISGSLASAVTSGGVQIGIRIKNNREVTYIKLPQYKKFLDTLNSSFDNDDTRFFKALEYVYPFYQKYEYFNNLPVIKYPGKPWRALEIPKLMVTLDETLIKNNKNTIDLTSLFSETKKVKESKGFRPPSISEYGGYTGGYPNIVLFATPEVKPELLFSDDKKINFPFFFSVIPGDAFHHITKITAPGYTLSEFLDGFLKIEDLQENKTFIIDEVIIKNNLTVIPTDLNTPTSFQHVVIQNKATPEDAYKPSRKSLYFEAKGKEWAAERVTMATPLEFALKEAKPGTVKNIISQLPGGLEKYYKESITK